MLSERTQAMATVDAQAALLTLFEDLEQDPFDYCELSEQIRPMFNMAQATAYDYIHEYCRKANCPERIGTVAIDFYSDTTFNACASTRGDHHAIAVSAGVPTLLLSIFMDAALRRKPCGTGWNSNSGKTTIGRRLRTCRSQCITWNAADHVRPACSLRTAG